MIELEIPGFGRLRVEHLVLDFTGTLSVDGKLLAGVKESVQVLSQSLQIHVLTSDTFGTAERELVGLPCSLTILTEPNVDLQKEQYVQQLGPERVVCIGNGNNDRRMLAIAALGMAVCQTEGCATDAIMAADILTTSITDALELLLHPERLKSTLRS